MYCDIHSHFISAGHLPPADSVDGKRNIDVGDDSVSREAAIESLIVHFPLCETCHAHTLLHTDTHLCDMLFYSSHTLKGSVAMGSLVVEMKAFVPLLPVRRCG